MGTWQQLSPSVPHQLAFGVACGLTDVGTVREANQDNFFIAPELGLVVVADGMGGHEAGEIASTDAINLLYNFIRAAQDQSATLRDPERDASIKAMTTLRDALKFANQRMYLTNLANDRADGAGMGTTLTGIWQAAPDGPLLVFHVGDSRLYRCRQGRLTQLTRDQTLYQQALESGAREPLPPRNLLLQALGPAAEVKPDLQTQTIAPGDVYLLCSDGLYGDSDAQQIEAILNAAQADNLDTCCAALVEMAKRDGSRDNITALLVKCGA